MTARLLVSGARVLTPGGEWPRGWIAVEGRRIAAMGQGQPPPGAAAGADVLAGCSTSGSTGSWCSPPRSRRTTG